MIFGISMIVLYGALSVLSAFEENWSAFIAWMSCLLLVAFIVLK